MTSMVFAGRVAMVTGGGSGIGRAICRVLARDGARVVAADRNHDAAKETVGLLINPSQHLAVGVDVTDRASVDGAITAACDKFSVTPSLLANAAGIRRDNFLLQMDEKAFMEVLDVNVKGTFLPTQAMAMAMAEREMSGGAVVNIASIVGKAGNLGQANYAASKAAVEGFTKTAARELAMLGIRVNAVLPGFTVTPMTADVPEKVIKVLLKMIPLKRLAEPDEIAEVVGFLLSERSSYMTGASIDVTGGLFM